LFELFSRFFSFFCFFWIGYLCVCCQCTHQGGDWGPERQRTGGWSLLAMINVVWTNPWTSIAGAGCSLICVGAGEVRARSS
jgi:hypothetical protein